METRTSRHKDLDHHSHQSSSSSPRNTVCVLSDHQPANHQEFELSVIGETTGRTAVNTENSKEHCAQDITSEFEDARTQRTSKESDTVMFDSQKEHCAQAIITGFDLMVRAHRTSIQIRIQLVSKDRTNIARRPLVQKLRMRAHRKSVQN